jgi:hypothetical protein
MGTLSTPFDALLADLHRAKDLYESGDEAACAGAIVSVEVVTRFLMAFRPVADSGLCRPLVALCAALKDLDDGVPSTLLAPLKLGHRGGSPRLSQILVGLAAYTADALIASGLKALEADDAVAGELRNMASSRAGKGQGIVRGKPRG